MHRQFPLRCINATNGKSGNIFGIFEFIWILSLAKRKKSWYNLANTFLKEKKTMSIPVAKQYILDFEQMGLGMFIH